MSKFPRILTAVLEKSCECDEGKESDDLKIMKT